MFSIFHIVFVFSVSNIAPIVSFIFNYKTFISKLSVEEIALWQIS